MAIATLTEGNKYSTTILQTVVTDLLAKESRVTEIIPFEDIPGNSLTYDVITTRSSSNFYGPGDTWTESTPELTQYTATLKIIGGDADVDNFLMATRNKIDMRTMAVNDKIRSINESFVDSFFYGSSASNSKQFNGLHILLASTVYNTVHGGTSGSGTGVQLSIARLRATIDLITGYRNQKKYIFMTKKMRTSISVYLDSIGSAFPRGVNEYGRPIQVFDDMEIVTDDNLLNTETAASDAYSAKTGGANTSIFILTMGAQACCGLSSPARIQTKELGELETKDAIRVRIKWYCALKVEDIRSCAKLDGVVAATTAAA